MRIVACVVLVVVAYVQIQPLSGQNADKALRASSLPMEEQHGIPAPTVWGRLAQPKAIQVLQFLADQTKGNYERVRTWKGCYEIYTLQHVSGTLPGLSPAQVVSSRPSTVRQEFRYVVKFVLDMADNSIYWEQSTQSMQFHEDGRGKAVPIDNVTPSDGRYIVTHEHFLEFSPDIRWPAFAALPNCAQAQNKRAAFRRSCDVLAPNSELLFDPRILFGFSHVLKFWEELGALHAALSGESGRELEALAERRLAVFESESPDGPWYRVLSQLDTPDKSSTFYCIDIWSPLAGYNPVLGLMSNDAGGENMQSMRQWKWKRIDGVYVPEMYRDIVLRQGSQSPQHSPEFVKELVLKSCTLNPPVPANQFDYVGLGLKNGDLVVDRIEGGIYMMEQGALQKLTSAAEETTGTGAKNGGFTEWRCLFAAVNLALLAFAMLLLRRSQKKKKGVSS